MSHIVEAKIPPFSNLEALERAGRALGLTLDMNRKQARYYAGKMHKCDGVMSHPDTSYEIALKKGTEGFKVEWGPYDHVISNICGANCGKLAQAYTVENLELEAMRQGYQTTRNVLQSGEIEVIATR